MLLVKVIGAAVSLLERTSRMRSGMAWDDAELDAVLRPVRAGRLGPGLDLIAAARGDNERRALRIEQLANAAEPHIDALAGIAGDDPDALLWLGATRIKHAWTIRGGSYAKYVGAERFQRFWEVLETAAHPLNRAAASLPEDPVPWEHLQWHAIGMQLGRTELDRIWKELSTRDPRLFAGHYSRAQVLCEKWYGSHEELLAFARNTVEHAKPGDPVVAVLPLAHFEIAWREMDDSALSSQATLEARFGDPDVAGELAWAADKWHLDLRPHPRAPEASHLFGAAFYYGGHRARAQRMLSGTGRRMPEILPWSAGSLTPGRHYARVRRELGVD
ncbi:hypothetical protein [Streptosporangium sp. NPDC051022]|uniref:hypothetical protein n=1 Tax=Streptosporangium sp. NPDC051022 TaxID=3155752 RepID=UPI00342A9A3E